jgi:Phytanoyl-CoA dioxygenase (PhyH)
MELTGAQKQSLYDQGFVNFPGIIPRELVDRALRAINASLGSQGIDPNNLTKFRAQSYCPELTASPAITGLINDSPVWSLAESAIGAGKIRPVKSGQIALRFPTMEEPGEPHAHIDGMYTPTNGVPKGTIANFTALIGVLLSDLPQAYSGNLAVWPGTHRLFETHFRERGPESLLEGMPQVEMPEPVQITGKAGDAVLCHYQVAHGITGNGSPNIRYAIYFRLSHVDHDNVHWECMTDIWREWEGMQGLAQAGVATQ